MALQATMSERCLLFLLDRTGIREHGPGVEKLTQEAIAEALGSRQAHISRAMKRLDGEGCVKIAKVHVREGKRRFAYFLTEKGVRVARDVRRRLENVSVRVVDLDGAEKRLHLSDVPPLLPLRPRFSDLVASLEDGRLDLRRFVTRQRSLHGGKVYDVRDSILVPHFSGRAESLSRLDRFLEDSKSRAFLLVGLPGMGKTALASRWISSLKGQIHVFWRCIRQETAVSDLLRDLADMLHSLGRPALSEYLSRPSEIGRDLSFDIVNQDLSLLRILIVIDNAHLAREDVAGFVRGLLTLEPTPTGPKLLLIARERVAFCTAEDRALGRLREEELANLRPPEAKAMLKAMGVSARRRDSIVEKCDGHPLCLELAASKAMPLDAIKRTSAARIAQDVLPRLGPEVRDTLAFAAMFDGAIPLELLGGHATDLFRFCLLREGEGDGASVHDVVREATLQGVPPDRLAAFHVRVGDFCARSRDPADVLKGVRHFVAGNAVKEAQELVVDRGQDVVDAGLAGSLLSLLEQLAWTSREGALGGRMLLLRGNALFALGRWAEAAREYERCSTIGEPDVAAESLLGLGKSEVQRRSPLALQHLKAAQSGLERLGALRLLAETQYWIGGVHEDSGRLREARDAFERGRAIAFSVADRRWEGLCRYGIGRVRLLLNDLPGEVEEEREALNLLEREGNRYEVAKVCTALGGALLAQGKEDEAEVLLARSVTEARRTGAMSILASGLYNLASLKHKVGKMKEAIPLLEEALVLNERLERNDEAAWCAAWLASEERLAGHTASGDAYASRATRFLSRTTEPVLRVQVLRNFARAALRTGSKADAKRYLVQAVAEARAAGLESVAVDLAGENEGAD